MCPPPNSVDCNNLSEAQGVRELFKIIKALRDEHEGEEDAGSADEEGEGEEEEQMEDDPLEEVPGAKEDDGLGVKEFLADMELDSQEEAQAPKFRYRAKSTLQSLPSTAVLGGSTENLATPASYQGALTGSKEEELRMLLQEISLFETGEAKHPDTARHDALLLMMGSPTRPSTARGLRFETDMTSIRSFNEVSITCIETIYIYVPNNRNR